MKNLLNPRQTSRVLATFFVLLVSSSAIYAQTEATKLRILLVIDTHAENAVGLGLTHDRDNLRAAMEKSLKGQKLPYTLTLLQGDDANPSKILNYYQTLKTNSTEALFFYYTGHGNFVPDKGQVLGLKHGSLERAAIA